MVDTALIDSLGLNEFIPASLVRWQALMIEAMAYFLDRLPPQRLGAIAAQQLALPADTEPAARLVTLLAQCPTLHKLGQVMARNPALDAGLRRHLQTLESMPASAAADALDEILHTLVPPDAGITLGRKALAEGSVAVVLPFAWREEGQHREGVFKILKPGIEARLAEELAILPGLARMLTRRGRQAGLPALDYAGTFSSVQRLLTREIRLDEEQYNMRCAETLLGRDGLVFVPPLLPWCSSRVTAMTRVMGGSLIDAGLPERERDTLADALIEALLAKPFWTRTDDALFHGDLHGGNLLLDDDHRVAVIDWSLVARISKSQREALTDLALGGLALDARRICNAFTVLGVPHDRDAAVQAHVEHAIDLLAHDQRVIGFDWLVEMLDALALQGNTSFGEELALFRKSWLTLSGVLHDLRGSVSADLPLLGAGLRHFLAEMPQRMLSGPVSRDFATHLSNSDLLQLASSGWATGIRYWNMKVAQSLREGDNETS